jgi:hypothetical protein
MQAAAVALVTSVVDLADLAAVVRAQRATPAAAAMRQPTGAVAAAVAETHRHIAAAMDQPVLSSSVMPILTMTQWQQQVHLRSLTLADSRSTLGPQLERGALGSNGTAV